ncbi:MAG: hypothetical protein N3G80_03000 [Candidatus Micrarchaeota archaeon]|nr:hypothetical protein [Candidatus Micrarchaeota archaeon]
MIIQELLSKIETALAAISAGISAIGLLMCIAAYVATFLFLQNIEKAVFAQLDSVSVQIENFGLILTTASAAAKNTEATISLLNEGVMHYASASKNISDTLSDIAKVPPFSLDARFSSSANSLRQASAKLFEVARTANKTSMSLSEAAEALRQSSVGFENAKSELENSKARLREGFAFLNLAALGGFLALAILLLSTLFVSISILLAHIKIDKKKASHD